MSTDLMIRDDQDAFTDKQVAVLQQLGVNNASPADFALFLHQCKRTGLDPFNKQIYMIGRWTKNGMRQTIQTGIDGFRLIASRTAETTGETYSTDGPYWCGEDGQWVDVWLKPDAPLAAKYTVKRGDGMFSAVARTSSYMPLMKNGEPMGLWGKMPDTMIAKCAEALALRKAFPQDLSGLYTSEEMQQADVPQVVNVVPVETHEPLSDETLTMVLDWVESAKNMGLTGDMLVAGVKWASNNRVTDPADLYEGVEVDKLVGRLKQFVESKQVEEQGQDLIEVLEAGENNE